MKSTCFRLSLLQDPTVFNRCNGIRTLKVQLYSVIKIQINYDLDKHVQAKTSDKRVRHFSDILAPLSRETKLNMRFQE